MFRSLLLALGLPVARPAHGLATVTWHPGIPGVSTTYYTVQCDGVLLSYHYGGSEADRVAAEINAHPTRSLDKRPVVRTPKPYSAR